MGREVKSWCPLGGTTSAVTFLLRLLSGRRRVYRRTVARPASGFLCHACERPVWWSDGRRCRAATLRAKRFLRYTTFLTAELDHACGSRACSASTHRTTRPSGNVTWGGGYWRHSGSANEQRGAKPQPFGGLERSGGAPGIARSGMPRSAPRTVEAIRPWV